MDRLDNRKRRQPKPGWWTLLAIALALIAVLFAKSTHSDTSPAVIQAYPHAHRAGAQMAWSIGVDRIPDLPTNTPVASTVVEPTGDVQSLAQSTVSYSFPGYLSYPDNVISSFPIVNSVGLVVVDAAWSPAAPLSLSVACGATTQSAVGSSDVSVRMSSTTSSCTVAIQEQGKVIGSIDYTLSVSVEALV